MDVCEWGFREGASTEFSVFREWDDLCSVRKSLFCIENENVQEWTLFWTYLGYICIAEAQKLVQTFGCKIFKQATADDDSTGIRWTPWANLNQLHIGNQEYKSINRHKVGWFFLRCTILAGQTSLLQVQWEFYIGRGVYEVYLRNSRNT